MYSLVVYLYVNGSGSITSVGDESANLSAVYFIVSLPAPSINYFIEKKKDKQRIETGTVRTKILHSKPKWEINIGHMIVNQVNISFPKDSST